MSKKLDLGKLFQGVSDELVENKDALNQADTYNHDHGDNMVETFNVITKAMKSQQKAGPSGQLAYASQMLRQSSNTGSAEMYADGLAQAAEQFQGKSITPDNAMQLIQSLLGGGQSAPQPAQQPQVSPDILGSLLGGLMGGASTSQGSQPQPDLMGSLLGSLMGSQSPSQTSQPQPDMLGSLLGSLMGGQSPSQPTPTPQAQSDSLGSLLGGLMGGQSPSQPAQTPQSQPDMLGSLLGSLMGGQPTKPQDDGLDVGDLVSAGMAYLNAKQQGKNSLEAILNALIASSQGGQTPYRAQSSALVIKTLLQMIGSVTSK
jgi:hypothetical protein